MIQFIYLVHEREFIRLNENTYKVGKMQGIDVQEYTSKIPKGSQMMLLIPVHNNKALEKEIIALFNEKYQQMDEYGRKYFSGDAQEMIKDISTKIGYYKLTGKQE
jgi:hypothetical protein